MKKYSKIFTLSAIFLFLFAVWTHLLTVIDVKSIGPNGSSVGFSSLNSFFHSLTGVNLALYTITDWLGLVPVFTGLGFAVFGLCQWIKRKSILKVDFSILILGGFYIIVFFAYFFFEEFVINYRPVLINGYLEASYPSSTTMLVMCVMPTAIMQFNSRIKNFNLKAALSVIIICFIIFMVMARLISGVHWLSDIIGGALLSLGLISLYYAVIKLKK